MTEDSFDRNGRLSRIDTLWSVVRQAHTSDSAVAASAQQQLLERYGGAIRRYLQAAVRDPSVADELFQEFAVKFIQGDFRSVDPERGRFRAFVKTVLFRMIAEHYRKKSSCKLRNVAQLPESARATEPDISHDEELFVVSWRNDVLARTWQALAAEEANGGPNHHSVLRLRVENPAASSEELAARFSEVIGKPISSGNSRVMLHRARERFAKLLIDSVADSIDSPDKENIEAELIDLRLIDYCRDIFYDAKRS